MRPFELLLFKERDAFFRIEVLHISGRADSDNCLLPEVSKRTFENVPFRTFPPRYRLEHSLPDAF